MSVGIGDYIIRRRLEGEPPGTDRRYNLIRLLGSGGMADVYEAVDKNGRRVALKRMRRMPGHDQNMLMTRFAHEAYAAMAASKRDTSGFLIKVFDAGIDQDKDLFIVMELVSEGYMGCFTLADYIEKRGVFTAKETLDFLSQIIEALDVLHRVLCLIHRDLKPANIMVTKSEKDGQFRIRLVDFGIAKFFGPQFDAGSGLTQANQVFGTPQYLAPEQFLEGGMPQRLPNNTIVAWKDHRAADYYALGVILYELVTNGKHPFLPHDLPGEMTELRKMLHSFVVDPSVEMTPIETYVPDVDPGLATFIGRLLKKRPWERPQNTEELRAFFERDFAVPFVERMSLPTMSPVKMASVPQGTEAIPLVKVVEHAPTPMTDTLSVPEGTVDKPNNSQGWVWPVALAALVLGAGGGLYAYSLRHTEQPVQTAQAPAAQTSLMSNPPASVASKVSSPPVASSAALPLRASVSALPHPAKAPGASESSAATSLTPSVPFAKGSQAEKSFQEALRSAKAGQCGPARRSALLARVQSPGTPYSILPLADCAKQKGDALKAQELCKEYNSYDTSAASSDITSYYATVCAKK